MISASFKRFWPADRIARLKKLQTTACSHGLTLRARNGGSRTVFLVNISFWDGDALVAQFWDLEQAELWLDSRRIAA